MGSGILDWLTDSIGGSSSSGSPPMPPLGGGMGEAGDTSSLTMPPSATPPVPVQPTGSDAPPLPPYNDSAGLTPSTAPNGGQPPPIPLPMARPAAADATPPLPMPRPPGADAPPTPPNAAPTAGAGTPPLPPSGPAPGGGSFGPLNAPQMNPQGPQAKTIIGRALGLDPNSEAQLRGSLSAGLKSVGDNWNKPGLAAAAGSAGAAMEGGKAADDKTVEQQSKYLTQAIAAYKAGDERSANQALTKLRLAQAQQAMTGKGGKDSVVNSDQQLYLRAQSATNQDLNLKAAKTLADKAAIEFGSDSAQAKAAAAALKKASDDTLNEHLTRLGLDPKKASQIGKMPGFSQDNPIGPEKLNSQAAFDALPPGSWFTNPKDKRVLQKPFPPAGAQSAGQGVPPPAGQAPQAAGTPPSGPQTDPAAAAANPKADPAAIPGQTDNDDDED